MISDGSKRRTQSFLWLFALAWAGGAIAYVPFLTIWLPLRVVTLAGADSVRTLGLITFCGAIAASVSNVSFGWLSDWTCTRRPWIGAGLVLTAALLVLMARARDSSTTLALVVCWQVALNMMLGPLSAWAADRVPRHKTGLLGGLMALSPALGALSGIIVTIPGFANAEQRLWLIAAMMCACVMPALMFFRSASPDPKIPQDEAVRPQLRFAITMWLARLLVQIAEAALFAYLLLYFRSLDPAIDESRVARLFGAVLAAAVPVAIVVGTVADKSSRPARPLALCALCSALGLIAMLEATTIQQAMAAYVLFGLATTIFLSVHSGQTLRVLPDPKHRGRDLGLFNLTNTAPSLIMPWLTIAVVPVRGYATLFGILAALAATSAAMLFWLKRLD
ncbi:MAG: MFS transporter [Sphingomicrobium sp.]